MPRSPYSTMTVALKLKRWRPRSGDLKRLLHMSRIYPKESALSRASFQLCFDFLKTARFWQMKVEILRIWKHLIYCFGEVEFRCTSQMIKVEGALIDGHTASSHVIYKAKSLSSRTLTLQERANPHRSEDIQTLNPFGNCAMCWHIWVYILLSYVALWKWHF